MKEISSLELFSYWVRAAAARTHVRALWNNHRRHCGDEAGRDEESEEPVREAGLEGDEARWINDDGRALSEGWKREKGWKRERDKNSGGQIRNKNKYVEFVKKVNKLMLTGKSVANFVMQVSRLWIKHIYVDFEQKVNQ